MAQIPLERPRTLNVGNCLAPYESVDTFYDPGQLDSEVEAPDNFLTAPENLITKLPKCANYKPTVLRCWFHGFLIICLAIFLGLTEFTIQTLLANNPKEDLVSQILPRSFEAHKGSQQGVPDQEESPYKYLARVPSNATSNQAGAYTVNTGGILASDHSSPTLLTSMDPESPSPTSLHTQIPSELLSYGETKSKASFEPVSPYSTDSYGHTTRAILTDITETMTETIPTKYHMQPGGRPVNTISLIDEYLNVGYSTFTASLSSKSTQSATDGDSFSPDVTTTTMMDVIILTPPSPTPSKAVGTVLEDASGPNDKHMFTIIQKTENLPSSETLTEMSPTDLDETVGAQHTRIISPGGTGVLQSTKTSSPEIHEGSVTVVRQTELWHSSKATFERTMTDSRGHVSVHTMTTDAPAKTDILETKVTIRPGETLVAVPRIITTARGGLTQVTQTTIFDFEGHMTTSVYTTVVGGESVLATHTYFLATSLPSGYTVLTVPAAVLMTEQEKVEVVQTMYYEVKGHVIPSFYTTRLDEIQTRRTVPVVIATPVSPGEKLVTLSTVIPTTIGGPPEAIQTTSTDGRGHPTTFSYTTIEGGTATSTTIWTIISTPTSTSSIKSNGTQDTGEVGIVIYGLGPRNYMLGTFLPTILAAIIALPFKLININVRLMQPFHELATARKADGVSAEASIFLRFYDWTGAISLPRSVRLKQPVIVISDFLVIGAALLAPIAAETVSVHVPGGCDSGCHGSLGVTRIPGRLLEALMATMMALLIALIVLIKFFRWETGVNHNPWGIAGMASLGLSPGIRDRIRNIPCDLRGSIKESMILEALSESKYALDEYWVFSSPEAVGVRRYGIVVKESKGDTNKLAKINIREHRQARGQKGEENAATQPFALLTWWGRCILLFIFVCVLIIATYYETTSLDSGFERFMDSRGFGIRFFFTALGVVIGGCLETFFRSVAIILPYQLLSKQALPAGQSILLSPSTNAFTGLHSAFRQRSIFLGAVSFATILAELVLPVTLSHVPFSYLDTYETQFVCTWLSIGILTLMILVILYSFCIWWPHMPVDPRTIAGAMFYLCDSWMLGAMDGMATLVKKDRDSIVNSQRLKYKFACSEGVSGKERMKVDVCRDTREASVMI